MPSNILTSGGEKVFYQYHWYSNGRTEHMVKRSLVILCSFWIWIVCAKKVLCSTGSRGFIRKKQYLITALYGSPTEKKEKDCVSEDLIVILIPKV